MSEENTVVKDNLGDINPNLPFVKRDLVNSGMRYGFKVVSFDATRLPSEGAYSLKVEVQKM